MFRILDAFISMIVRWMTPTPKEVEAELTADTCQCGHARCCHSQGKYKCGVYPDYQKKDWICACVLFIKKGGGQDNLAPDPEPDSGDKEPSPEDIDAVLKGLK